MTSSFILPETHFNRCGSNGTLTTLTTVTESSAYYTHCEQKSSEENTRWVREKVHLIEIVSTKKFNFARRYGF